MTQRAFSFLSAMAFALVVALAPMPAQAQRALQQVLDLNRQAMEAYNNLEIEQAQSLLEQALTAAQRGRVTGAPLARTYMNLGVVAIGGLGDNGAGLNYFSQALAADPNVQLDPLTSTPDIQTTYALARQRAGGGGGAGPTPVTPTPEPTPEASPAVGNLSHVPVPEQLAQTAVPVYIEVPGRPAHVYLFYRAHGMREFQRVEMGPVGRGYGYEIPCTDVFEPSVSYYIVAFGADGSPTGFAGSQAAPINVSIVSRRTHPEPALPGRAPPTTCGERECPPGMSCNSGGRGMGEACTSNSQCASGICRDDMCAMSNSGGGGGSGSSSRAPNFFFRVGGGLGLSWVSPGMQADRFPCEPGDMSCFLPGDGQAVPGWTIGDLALSRANGYEPSSYSANSGDQETACGLTDEDGYGDDGRYCLYVRDAGFVPNFQLRLEVGYFVLPWLGFSAFARIQPISGMGTLSMALIGARVHFRVLDVEPAEGAPASGPFVHLHVGGSGGQIQVAVPNNGPAAPYGISGMGGFHFGSTIGYRFMENVALFVNPDVMFQVPSFLFNLDVTVGIEAGF